MEILQDQNGKQSMTPLYEQINLYRVVPRLLVLGYSWLMYEVAFWFMSLPNPMPEQAAFVSTMVGVSAAIFGLYANSGRPRA